MFKTTLTPLIFTLLVVANQAKADHVENQNFSTAVQAIVQNSQSVQAEPLFDKAKQVLILSSGDFSALNKIAVDQAQIWGDTILEGDYESDGKTEIDHVDALKKDGQLVAYRLIYSERAWDTSECTFPGNRDAEALSQCQEGRIRETSYVSPDLTSWIRDPNAFASFDLN